MLNLESYLAVAYDYFKSHPMSTVFHNISVHSALGEERKNNLVRKRGVRENHTPKRQDQGPRKDKAEKG